MPMSGNISLIFILLAVVASSPVVAWWKPTPGTSYQIQLGGDTLDLSFDVEMYDVDLDVVTTNQIDELHARGIKVICYFSAGSYEDFRDYTANFSKDAIGKAMDGWPGEYWVNTEDQTVRDVCANRIKIAKEKGCDGVDPDNVNGAFVDTGFDLTPATQLSFNKFLAETAHALDLSVGLKNDLEQVEDLVDDFDFQVNEQCVEMDECDLLKPFIAKNKAVFGIEYEGDKEQGCATANALNFDTIFSNLDLSGERYACRKYVDNNTSSASAIETGADATDAPSDSLSLDGSSSGTEGTSVVGTSASKSEDGSGHLEESPSANSDNVNGEAEDVSSTSNHSGSETEETTPGTNSATTSAEGSESSSNIPADSTTPHSCLRRH